MRSSELFIGSLPSVFLGFWGRQEDGGEKCIVGQLHDGSGIASILIVFVFH